MTFIQTILISAGTSVVVFIILNYLNETNIKLQMLFRYIRDDHYRCYYYLKNIKGLMRRIEWKFDHTIKQSDDIDPEVHVIFLKLSSEYASLKNYSQHLPNPYGLIILYFKISDEIKEAKSKTKYSPDKSLIELTQEEPDSFCIRDYTLTKKDIEKHIDDLSIQSDKLNKLLNK